MASPGDQSKNIFGWTLQLSMSLKYTPMKHRVVPHPLHNDAYCVVLPCQWAEGSPALTSGGERRELTQTNTVTSIR